MSIKALHLFRLFILLVLLAAVNFAVAATTPSAGSLVNTPGAPVPTDVKGAGGKNPFIFNITLGFPAIISDKKETTPAPAVRDSNALPADANVSRARIYEFGANTELGAIPARHHTNEALRQAMNLDVDLVYIHLNAFADFDGAAMDIRNKLTEYNKPMTVFIDNGSKGSGAIISLRADSSDKSDHQNQVKTSVYSMAENQFQEKYKTYVNSIVNHGVKANDQKSSAVLSCNSTSPTPLLVHTQAAAAPASAALSAANIVLYNYHPRFFERILDFLLQPFLSFLLIFIIALGLLLEFRQPGTGFPLFASVAASLLFFIPLHMDGFADSREIFLFLGGIALLLANRIWPLRTFFLIPTGFSLAGIALVACLSPAFLLSSLSGNGWRLILQPLVIVSSALITTGFAYYILTKYRILDPEKQGPTSLSGFPEPAQQQS